MYFIPEVEAAFLPKNGMGVLTQQQIDIASEDKFVIGASSSYHVNPVGGYFIHTSAFGPGYSTASAQATLAADDILDVAIEHEDYIIAMRLWDRILGNNTQRLVSENAD